MDTSGMEWLGGAPHCTEERHSSSGGRRKRKRNYPSCCPTALKGWSMWSGRGPGAPQVLGLYPGHPWAPDPGFNKNLDTLWALEIHFLI